MTMAWDKLQTAGMVGSPLAEAMQGNYIIIHTMYMYGIIMMYASKVKDRPKVKPNDSIVANLIVKMKLRNRRNICNL